MYKIDLGQKLDQEDAIIFFADVNVKKFRSLSKTKNDLILKIN